MLGFQDEVWWSRLARPTLHAWAEGGPKRLHEPPTDSGDRAPKALACYGILRGDTGGMMLRSTSVVLAMPSGVNRRAAKHSAPAAR